MSATDAEIAALVERRRKVRVWWTKDLDAADAAWDPADGPAPVGLALSGGGIRSATFSLGLIQALATSRRDALAKIDVLSTVSGGGYVGCFLRSLFVPNALRGIASNGADDGDLGAKIADQYRLARHALASGADAREIDWTPGLATTAPRLRSPLWWLREHSRYLAPTGPTDYGFAIAYVARNWMAMIYLVVLACVALGTALISVEAAILQMIGWEGPGTYVAIPASPLFVLAAIPVAWSGALMIAYWSTQAMSTNEANVALQRANLRKAVTWIAAAALSTAVLVAVILSVAPAPGWPYDATTKGLGRTFLAVIAAGLIVSVAGAALGLVAGARLRERGALMTTELRRILTGKLARSNRVLTVILVVAAIDSLGAWLDLFVREWTKIGAVPIAMLPVLAFVIKKLPDWFGGDSSGTAGGGIGGFLKRFATTVAMVVGLLLYASLAVAAAALIHHVMWEWQAWSTPRWWRMALLAGIAWVLTILLGKSNGFINLSSLHALYASRLTRAYLGATNVERLEAVVAGDAPITENHERDYVQPRVYGETDLPAPIHVIHVTLNETIDPNSQIVSRDRKGDILSLEPGGVRVGRGLVDWHALKTNCGAENISLGQWIAISGAAASSGMGRMSSLGLALAFTFANVRLGYWWYSPHLCPDMPVVKGFGGWLARNFGTFVYLMNEMTCRYSRGYFRKYLTDGGHYENSGAYALIRRRVPLIVVTDNGADPDYAFGDLESLVRQVRIDMGAEATVLGGVERDAVLTTLGATDHSIFVDPHVNADWRTRMLQGETTAFVLVLRVLIAGETLHMIWLKPRLLPGAPTDVAGYAIGMKAFPQQPTGDQFFDEAQWESYRRLGEFSMTRLLDTCPKLLA